MQKNTTTPSIRTKQRWSILLLAAVVGLFGQAPLSAFAQNCPTIVKKFCIYDAAGKLDCSESTTPKENELVTYRITATNQCTKGSDTLDKVNIIDPNLTGSTNIFPDPNHNGTLLPGQSVTIDLTKACTTQFENTATLTAFLNGSEVNAESTTRHNCTPTACLCEYANPAVADAGLCTVFQMGFGKVSMSNGAPTGDFGNLCMVGGNLSMSGGQIVKGKAYLGASVTISMSGSTQIQGGIVQPYDLTAQVNAALNAYDQKRTLTCNQSLGDLKRGGTIAATVDGENVICVNNVALNQVVTLTSGGHSNVSFVINVKGGFALTGGPGGQIRVQAPLAPKDVLINVLGTGSDVKFSGGGNASVVDGTILAPYRKIGLSPGLVNGQIMSTMDISISSGGIVDCPACQ